MKRTAFLIWLIAACGIALPSECLASYLIKLKNGSQYVTSEYWEEGNKIQFNFSGGQIGFSKDSVLRITETDLPVQAEIITPAIPSTDAEPASEAEAPSNLSDQTETRPLPQNDSTPKGLSAEEKETILAEKNAMFQKFQTATQDLNKAKAQGSREAIERERENLLNIRKQLDQLRKNAADRSGGKIPNWWVDSVSFGVLQA